jgi:8-amino-7-oxononanoate synthase
MSPYSVMETAPGPETVIDGVRYLYFGGTSYLGLAAHPEVIEAGCAALRLYGVHTATTRALFGSSPPVLEVEKRAAEFFGVAESFYFASGYSSNHVLMAALAPGAEAVFVEDAAHYSIREAALFAGAPVVTFRRGDAAHLAELARGRARVLVMADAIGPVTGVAAPVPDYLRGLACCERAVLLLDDAHGFGVLGPDGRGLLDQFGLWNRVNRFTDQPGVSVCVSGTLSKALGGFGGIIPGSRAFVECCRRASHYFDGASAPAAAVAAATAKALEIVMREPMLRQRLHENTSALRAGLRAIELPAPEGTSAHFSVSLGDAQNMRRIHEGLRARGIMLPYMPAYSGAPAEGALRFAVFANHTGEQISRLVAELEALV